MAASERFLCDESNQEFKAWVLDFKTKQAFRSAQSELYSHLLKTVGLATYSCGCGHKFKDLNGTYPYCPKCNSQWGTGKIKPGPKKRKP